MAMSGIWLYWRMAADLLVRGDLMRLALDGEFDVIPRVAPRRSLRLSNARG
jgi:hypothetical protein